MTSDREVERARQYLLGEADEAAAARLEEEFFRDGAEGDHVAAVEEALIEDYLGGRLTPDHRARFEHHYMAAPHHRVRVETVRRLMNAAAQSRAAQSAAWPRWWSGRYSAALAAAAVLVLIAGAVWTYSARTAPNGSLTRNAGPVATVPLHDRNLPAAAAVPPRVFAMSLSPVALRSAGTPPTLVVPAGTDIVSFRLEGEGEPLRAAGARVIVRKVAGDPVWQGAAIVGDDLPQGIAARVDVPASVLLPDDYVIEVRTDRGGAEREWYHYVLRVRAPGR